MLSYSDGLVFRLRRADSEREIALYHPILSSWIGYDMA
jgi:hypothetical protein